MRSLLLAILLATTTALPVQEDETTPTIDIEKEVNVLPYTTNFKNMMAEYVRLQHNNLTSQDMESVKDTLEEFLQGFARDLHEIILTRKIEEKELIEDGIPDVTFDEIKNSVKNELSDANEEMADQIVYKLRKNLFDTRKKLDRIICHC